MAKRTEPERPRWRVNPQVAAFLLDFIRAAGPEGVDTAAIRKHWRAAGLTRDPYGALSQMHREGLVRKFRPPMMRLTRYAVV